jgi:hypothetical protein
MSRRKFLAVYACDPKAIYNIIGIQWDLKDKDNKPIKFDIGFLNVSRNKKGDECRWRYVIYNIRLDKNTAPYTLTATAVLNDPLLQGKPQTSTFDFYSAAPAKEPADKKAENKQAENKKAEGKFSIFYIPVVEFPDPNIYTASNPYPLTDLDLDYFAPDGDSDKDIGAPNTPPTLTATGSDVTGMPGWSNAFDFWSAEFDGLRYTLQQGIPYQLKIYNADGTAAYSPWVQWN